ncbi:MAG: hypothetical protein K1X29_00600 [Bdellovibrionales bacterium]|nr:hypothetical protein [Bdellovibrionales bacterium]
MYKKIFKWIFFLFSLRQKQHQLTHWKIKSIRTYLKVLQGTRYSIIALIVFNIILQLMGLGFITALGALIFLSPWSLETKLWFMAGLGFFLFLIPLILFSYIFSNKHWYELSGVKNITNSMLNDSTTEETHDS